MSPIVSGMSPFCVLTNNSKPFVTATVGLLYPAFSISSYNAAGIQALIFLFASDILEEYGDIKYKLSPIVSGCLQLNLELNMVYYPFCATLQLKAFARSRRTAGE